MNILQYIISPGYPPSVEHPIQHLHHHKTSKTQLVIVCGSIVFYSEVLLTCVIRYNVMLSPA